MLIAAGLASQLHAAEHDSTAADAAGEDPLLDTDRTAVEPVSIEGWEALKRELAETRGFEFELGYTMHWQYASDVVDESDSLLAGSFDFAGNWSLGPGMVGWLLEGGQIISHNEDESLSDNVGALQGINDDLDNEDVALTELWWAQRFLGEQLTVTIGKLDQTVYHDANAVANDETTQFISTPLVNNLAIPFPDNGLGINVRWDFADNLYGAAGFADGEGDANSHGFDKLDADTTFVMVETGVRVKPGGREGNYRLMGWRSEVDDEDGLGIALSADQRISEHLVLFGRYGTADDEVSDFEHAVSGGIGLQEPFGRESDLVALGAAWADGGDAGDETLIEAFYRIGVIKQLAVTPHLQVVVDPPGQPDDDAVVVAGVRLQLTF